MPSGRLLDLQHIVLAPQFRIADAVLVTQPAEPIHVEPVHVVPVPAQPAPAEPPAPAPAVVQPMVLAPAALSVLRSDLVLDASVLHVAAIDATRLRPSLEMMRPELFVDKTGQDFERKDSPHPISPILQPNDAMVFEDPNSDVRYWLPRYRLRELSNGRYDSHVTKDADGRWAISLGLEAYPAPEIADAARTAKPLPHQLAVSLSYRQPNTTIERRLTIDELLTDPRGPVAILRLSLAERDELLGAFMSPTSETTLSIVRNFTVATPSGDVEASPPKRRFHMRDHTMMMRALTIEDAVVAPAVEPEAPPAAVVSPRVDMRHIRRGIAQPALEDAALRARPIRVMHTTPEIVAEPTVAPRYRAAPQVQPLSIPLRFPPALHPYLYPGGSPSAGGASWDIHNLAYSSDGRSRNHVYFQSTANPARFYYLPDEFRLARRGIAPFTPALAFVVDQGQDASSTTEVELAADVRPVTDGKRLLAARLELKKKLPTTGATTPAEISLEPLLAKASLRLGLPRNGLTEMTQVNVDIDLANGFQLSERFKLDDDFQDIFAALMASQTSSLLQGRVLVSTGLGGDVQIPVNLNFHRLEGEVFDYTEVTEPVSGTVSATLRNDSGGKLKVSALPVWLSRNGVMVDAKLEGIDLSRPIEIEPDAEIGFKVVPVAAWPAGTEGLCDAIFDTSSISSIPDSERLFVQTFDSSVAQEATRSVIAMTDTEMLESAQAPENAVRLIIIEFRGNISVRLSSTKLEQTVEVPVPLMDRLLNKDTQGTYKFRQTIIYKSGRQQVDSAWRETDTAVLFVPST